MFDYGKRLENLTADLKKLPEYKLVNEYFLECIKKVFVARRNYLEKKDELLTLKEYLDFHYQGMCYYYSTYIIMALKNTDRILRGPIDVYEKDNSNYHHGWCEFDFDGKVFVYDNLLRTPVEKGLYYEHKQPEIYYETTLEDVIEKYTKEENCDKIDGLEYSVKSFSLVYNQFTNRDLSHMASAMSNSKIILSDDKKHVKKFIAREASSC